MTEEMNINEQSELQAVTPDETRLTGHLLGSRKLPPVVPFVIGAVMFGAAFWAGGTIATGEIAGLELDSQTAQGHVMRVKVNVPAGELIPDGAVVREHAYANRIEPYCITSQAAVAGKKTRYGLEVGQIVTARDLF
jgi:hypothetical protein